MNDFNHYNSAPEGLQEISLQEWATGIFHYCIQEPTSRQVTGEHYYKLRLFPVPNFENKPLGYALKTEWRDQKTGERLKEDRITFCRYGAEEDWKKFTNRFAAQFAGDNS